MTKDQSIFGPNQVAGAPSHIVSRKVEFNSSKDEKLDIAPESTEIPMRNLNPVVIETWLTNTLTDAECKVVLIFKILLDLNLPGVILKPSHKPPLSRYQIDRMSLANEGLDGRQIDRLYNALFVYSVGFYEMIGSL